MTTLDVGNGKNLTNGIPCLKRSCCLHWTVGRHLLGNWIKVYIFAAFVFTMCLSHEFVTPLCPT